MPRLPVKAGSKLQSSSKDFALLFGFVRLSGRAAQRKIQKTCARGLCFLRGFEQYAHAECGEAARFERPGDNGCRAVTRRAKREEKHQVNALRIVNLLDGRKGLFDELCIPLNRTDDRDGYESENRLNTLVRF